MNWMNRSLAAASLAAAFAIGSVAVPAFAADPRDRDRDVPRIVQEARVVKESKDSAEFVAPADGQVWLHNASTKQTLHSITVLKGNTYRFDTRENMAWMNNSKIPLELSPRDTYQIFFVTAEERDARNAGRSDRDRDRDDVRADRDRERDRDRIGKADRARVPDTARMVAEGRDRDLSYKAEADGTVYLWDNDNNRVINTFNVDRGQRLTVDPTNSAVSLDGRRLDVNDELSRRITYRMLFDERR